MKLTSISSYLTADSLYIPQEYSKYVGYFLRYVKQQIDDVNQLIFDYNRLTDKDPKDQKIAKLREIYYLIKTMNDEVPPIMIQYCKQYYTTFNKELLGQVQEALKALGEDSLEPDLIESSPQKILANLSPDKLEQLTSALNDLKDEEDEKNENFAKVAKYFNTEKNVFQVRVLGGKNSRSFILQNSITREECVLKMEDRLGLPRHVETYLRNHDLSDVLAPVLAERQVTYTDGDKLVTKTLLITSYCSGGDLDKAAQVPKNDRAKQLNAINLYMQMAKVLERIEAQKCIFTDMKNSNWLLDENGKLRIADTKGLNKTDENGVFDYRDKNHLNFNCGHVAHSPFMDPPKLFESNFISAQASHAYMLGKNLYQYLTNTSPQDLDKIRSVQNLNFNSKVFQGPRGEGLKALIIDLMHPSPQKRLSMTTAIARFEALDNLLLASLNIGKLKLSAVDQAPQYFFDAMNQAHQQANTDSEKAAFMHKLHYVSQALDRLQEQKQTLDLKDFESRRDMIFSFALESRDGFLNIPEPIQENKLHSLLSNALVANQNIKGECYHLLYQISAFQISDRGVHDVEMITFRVDMLNRLKAANNESSLEAIRAELTQTLESLQQSLPIVQLLQSLINKEEIGMAAKGKKIAEALTHVPLTQRGNIVEQVHGGTTETEAVLEALGSPRFLRNLLHSVKKSPDGSILPVNPKGIFKEFKEKQQELLHKNGKIRQNDTNLQSPKK